MMRASQARGRSLSGNVRETVEHDLRNIQMLRNSLEFDRVAALAKRIHRAKRVIVIGGDLAANLVGFLRYHLLFLGLPVIAATSGGETTHLVRSTGKRDLIIAISFRRCLSRDCSLRRRTGLIVWESRTPLFHPLRDSPTNVFSPPLRPPPMAPPMSLQFVCSMESLGHAATTRAHAHTPS